MPPRGPDTDTGSRKIINDVDAVRRHQDHLIDTLGWAVTAVLPTTQDPVTACPFAYTVGLTAAALVLTGDAAAVRARRWPTYCRWGEHRTGIDRDPGQPVRA
jgi:hypothetical protein